MCLKHIEETDVFDEQTQDLYSKNFVAWYDTVEYQAWSVHAQLLGQKYDGTIRSYKMPAKEYIYEVDKNQHYRDFKSKLHSNYVTAKTALQVKAMLADGTLIFND